MPYPKVSKPGAGPGFGKKRGGKKTVAYSSRAARAGDRNITRKNNQRPSFAGRKRGDY